MVGCYRVTFDRTASSGRHKVVLIINAARAIDRVTFGPLLLTTHPGECGARVVRQNPRVTVGHGWCARTPILYTTEAHMAE